MNKELKTMLYCAFLILAIIAIVINVVSLSSSGYVEGVTKSSQRLALNRLKIPRLKHSSEIGGYPRLRKHEDVKLIAVKKDNRLYVVKNHQVIYIINAKINHSSTTTRLNAARGEVAFHVEGKTQSIAEKWISFDKLGYIETPVSIDGQKVKGNWLKDKSHVPNAIEVSRPDAKWLQQLPKGTEIVIN